MEIIKKGNLKKYYFKCEECGCEFIADETETEEAERCDYNNNSAHMICPCCHKNYCKGEIFTDSSKKEPKTIPPETIHEETEQIANLIFEYFSEVGCENCENLNDKNNFCHICVPNWKVSKKDAVKIAKKISDMAKRNIEIKI